MSIKILSIIAGTITVINVLKGFEKRNIKAMLSNSFILLTMAQFMRVYL